MLEEVCALLVAIVESVWSYCAAEWVIFSMAYAYIAVDVVAEKKWGVVGQPV